MRAKQCFFIRFLKFYLFFHAYFDVELEVNFKKIIFILFFKLDLSLFVRFFSAYLKNLHVCQIKLSFKDRNLYFKEINLFTCLKFK